MFNRKSLILPGLLLAVATAALAATKPIIPSAQDILEGVRMRQAQQEIDVRGQLRQENVIVPFQLVESGPRVRYVFSNPPETLQLQIGENDSRLELITQSGAEKIAPA